MSRGIQYITQRKLVFLGCLVLLLLVVLFFYTFFNAVLADSTPTISFPSLDGLEITADTYISQEAGKTPMVIMFHQAHWSRGEYREAGPRFNEMGYNAIAVDLRSGNEVLGIVNQTALRAREKRKKTRYIDAMQDVRAALAYARSRYHPTRLLAIGSSYSAGLLLKAAGEYPGLVDGIILFSPGEYFTDEGMPHDWVSQSARKITIPVFITSARQEKSAWAEIYHAINTKSKFSYIPITNGQHGSRSLWSRFEDNEGYWRVIDTFLKSFF